MKNLLYKITHFWKYNDWIGHGVGGALVSLGTWWLTGSALFGFLAALVAGVLIEFEQRNYSFKLSDYNRENVVDIARTCLVGFVIMLIF